MHPLVIGPHVSDLGDFHSGRWEQQALWVQKHHMTLYVSEEEDTGTEPGPKASSGTIVWGRAGTA